MTDPSAPTASSYIEVCLDAARRCHERGLGMDFIDASMYVSKARETAVDADLVEVARSLDDYHRELRQVTRSRVPANALVLKKRYVDVLTALDALSLTAPG